MLKWTKTKLALSNLERLLTCSICKNLVQDPCTLEACDHHFCRNCVENLVGVNNKCPECGVFAWSKDLRVNRRLAEIVSLCASIRNTVGNNGNIDKTSGKEETCSFNNTTGATSENNEELMSDADLKPHKDEQSNNSNSCEKSEQLINSIDKENVCNNELDSYSSQESENEPLNSSIELFSNSFCFENDTIQSGTQSKYSINTSVEEQDLEDGRNLIPSSLDKPENLSAGQSMFNTDKRTKTFVQLDEPENNLEAKGKKRKMSESELDHNETEGKLLATTSNVQEQLCRLKEDKLENESIKSDDDGDANRVSSSTKKKSRTTLPHKNMTNSNACLTPQTKNRKDFINSPASIISVVELSPAQLTKRNKRGEGLLHIAAIKGNIDDARYLLEKGADPNARDNAGWSPLHEACNHGYVGIAEMLLDNGAIIDLLGGPEHETPLHDAVANGRLEVARLLVQRGASLKARNNQGLTPLDYALTNSMKDLLKQTSVSKQYYSSTTTSKENILLTNIPQAHGATKVLLYTGLSTEQKEELELCASVLDGKVVNEFSVDVTHIVTTTNDSGYCRRTMKYLCGILHGKWIVSFGWITKCLYARTWVDESPFEVNGTSNAKTGIPHHARMNYLKQLPGLFDGCQFFFSGTFDPKTPCKEELIKLVKYGGGKVLSREPKQEIDYSLFIPSKDHNKMPLTLLPTVAYHARPDSTQYRCTIYIIYDPLLQNKQPERNKGLSVAPVGWLLDCISNFEIIDIEHFLQT